MKNYVKYPIIPIAFFYVNGIFFSDKFVEFISVQIIWLVIAFLFVTYFTFQFIPKLKLKAIYKGQISSIIICLLFFLVACVAFQYSKFENKFKNENYYSGCLTIEEILKPNKFQKRYFATFQTKDNIQQKILLYQDTVEVDLKVGDRIVTTLLVNEISKPKNPHQFDYAKYLANKNIFVQAKLSNHFTNLKPATGFKFELLYFREKLMNSFDIQNFSSDVKGVVYALLFGQRADLSEKIQSDYRNAGVMHILAISGMHIGILYWIMNLIFSSFIRSKNMRFFIVISLLICFAIISGLSGSVVRAVLMFLIAGSGVLFKRKTATVNILAVSLFLILVINPNFLFDVGFQMSYLAVFSIVYLYPIIRDKIRSKYKVVNYFNELIGISFVAQIGILPLMIYYFGQIPLLFLFGNLVVIPILTVVLIGLVFLLILNFIWKEVAIFFGNIIAFLIELANNAIAIIASKNEFIISDIKLSKLQCLLFLALVFMIAYAIKQFSYKKIMTVFLLIIGIQFSYFYDVFQSKSTDQLLMLYDYNSITISKTKNQKMIVFSSDSLILYKSFIADAKKQNQIKLVDYKPMKNYMKIDRLNFLVVDSLGISEVSTSIDVLILKDNPKFNLERYLQNHQPKLVVFHPKNYNTNVAFWKQTCTEKKIPFHNMREKGYLNLSN